LKDLDIDERIILKLIVKKWNGIMKCIGVVQNRDRWRTLATVVINDGGTVLGIS
jgi:hypothetical protein